MIYKNLFIILIILFSTILIEGCTSYYEDETYVIDSGYYVSYQFILKESDYLDVSINSHNGPVDVMILDSNNFYKYDDETSNADYYEYDELFENVISKDIQFTAPMDGEWYLIIENNEDYDITIDLKYEAY